MNSKNFYEFSEEMRILRDCEDIDLAVQKIEISKINYCNIPEYWVLLCQFYLLNRDIHKAEAVLLCIKDYICDELSIIICRIRIRVYHGDLDKSFEDLSNSVTYIKSPDRDLVLSSILARQDKFTEALGILLKSIENFPEYFDLYLNIALVYYKIGEWVLSEKYLKILLSYRPKSNHALLILADIYKKNNSYSDLTKTLNLLVENNTGRIDYWTDYIQSLILEDRNEEAIISSQIALKAQENYIPLLVNYAAALQNTKKMSDAEAVYVKILNISDDIPEVWFNLGSIYSSRMEFASAESCFLKAVNLFPDNLRFIKKYVDILFLNRKHSLAEIFLRRLILNNNSEIEIRSLYGQSLMGISNIERTADISLCVVRCITEGWTRPSSIIACVIDLIKQNPLFINIINCLKNKTFVKNQLYINQICQFIRNDKILYAIISCSVIPDIQIEMVLKEIRNIFLDIITNKDTGTIDRDIRNFLIALSENCFLGEYITSISQSELENLSILEMKYYQKLESNECDTLSLIMLSCYKPVVALENHHFFLNNLIPDDLRPIIQNQVIDYYKELELSKSIEIHEDCFKDVTYDVSLQYEENPYPRWAKVPHFPAYKSAIDYFLQKFSTNNFVPLNSSCKFNVLIAGCGTGQQIVEARARYGAANYTVIDLSLKSLSYAKRICDKLGYHDINYIKLDLNKISELKRRFEIIECSGVLHHTHDLFLSWEKLADVLTKNGVMFIGLYSKLARRNIIKFREASKELRKNLNPDVIRIVRNQILDNYVDHGDFNFAKSLDFYSTSGVRDLIFNTHERCTDLLEIDEFLTRNGLNFLFMEIDPLARSHYFNYFSNNGSKESLHNWNKIELSNPDLFFGMYQFWVQKI